MRAILLLIVIQLASCTALKPSTTKPVSTLDPATANVEAILREAKSLSNASQSTKAAKLIEDVILYHPDNPQLSAALSTYQKLSEQEMSWLESDALVKRALWLRSELRKESVAVVAKPSYWKSLRISQLEVKQNHAHEDLIRCAEENIAFKPELSRRCLNASNKDQLTEQQFERVQALRNQLRQSEIAKVINEQILPEAMPPKTMTRPTSTKLPSPKDSLTKTQQEVDTLELALYKKDYLWAKKLSNSLKKSDTKDNKEAQRLIKIAEKEIQAYAERIALRADAMYLQEKVAEADALWLQLIKLDPDNQEYRQNHERAEKILKNIKTIKEEHENGENPPSF